MSNVKILVVEDDDTNLLTLEAALFNLGYADWLHADSSEAALEIIKSNKPDVILMDISIKGNLDGIGFAKAIKHLGVPVIFITGFDDAETHRKAKVVNPNAYLVKPFNNLTLETAIDAATRSFVETVSTTEENFESPPSDVILKDCIFIKNGTILQKVLFADILWIKSEGNYSIIYTEQKKFAIRISLSRILERLPDVMFVRVHKRYSVQIALIDRIDTFYKELYIGKNNIPIGRTYKEQLLTFLNKI